MSYIGNNEIGKMYLGITEIAKEYLGSDLVYGSGSGPGPDPGQDVCLLSWTSAQVFAGGSIGGYINTSTGKSATSGNYYGIVISVDGYQGGTMKFTRASGASFFRFAFLKTCSAWSNGGTLDYSDATGYTSQVQVDDSTSEVVIPSDTCFVYVYTYSSGANMAPDIELWGLQHSSTMFSLEASLFTANKTIGANGTEYTGNNAKTICCTTNQLAINQCTFNYQLSGIVNAYPSQFDTIEINVATYTARKTFIKRYDYARLPTSYTLAPGECYVHIMVAGSKNGTAVEISSVLFDNDDIQLVVNDF